MELPNEKGTYVLIAFVPQMKHVEVGQLGDFDVVPGFYAFVGSAFEAGGLAARIGHHLESATAPHWHIDYLAQTKPWCENGGETYAVNLDNASRKNVLPPHRSVNPCI